MSEAFPAPYTGDDPEAQEAQRYVNQASFESGGTFDRALDVITAAQQRDRQPVVDWPGDADLYG